MGREKNSDWRNTVFYLVRSPPARDRNSSGYGRRNDKRTSRMRVCLESYVRQGHFGGVYDFENPGPGGT
jgi:hypothetical protein